jgi:hypothetical protein
MPRLHVVWNSSSRIDADPLNVSYFYDVLPAEAAYDFSSIASSADEVTQAMANLFDLTPAI